MSRCQDRGSRATTIERTGARRALRIHEEVASQVRRAREDAGLSLRHLARSAGVSHSSLLALERGSHDPTTEVLARVSAALGLDLSVRLYPNTGPLVRDHLQAAMIESLSRIIHERWRPTPEVAVQRPVRAFIDLVLETNAPPLVATEVQSELRRLEQQIRWSKAKADALAEARGQPTSSLLLLRSTRRTRAVVAEFAATLRAAYPASVADTYASLIANGVPWPGAALMWCRVEQGQATILDRPPRVIDVGR